MPRFNGEELTEHTIQLTRQHFADNDQACIDEVASGAVRLPAHTSQESYFAWRRQSAEDSLAGKNDHTLAFLQCAYWIQTGKSVALLP